MKYINLLLLILPLLAIFASCISRQYPVNSTYQETAYRTENISETYTENETAVETLSGQYELTPFYSWYSQNIAFSGKTNVSYIAYDIPQTPPYDNVRLIVSIWKQLQYEPATISVFDMTQGGHLSTPAPATDGDTGKGQVTWTWITGSSSDSWLDAANTRINQALFLGGRNYLWSKQADPQIIELNAGRAQKIGVIISGPQNSWNSRITVAATWSSSTTSYQPVTKERKIEKQVPYTVQKQKTIYETRQAPFWEVLFSP